MSEDSTIRQEIVLEDKVTPALDSMLKSIQGTTTAMGELLASVSRFQNAASQGGFNINFEQTADAVRNISDAYENAARHAQGLSDVASNIQVAAPIPASVSNPAVSAIQPDALPVATSSPTASANIPTGLQQLNAEYSNLKGQLSSIFQEIAANAQSRFASMTAPARQVFQDIALTAQIQMSNVRAEVERFVAPARQAFQNLALSAKIRFASMTAPARQAFSNIALTAQIRFSSIQSKLSAVANSFRTRFGPAFNTIGRIGSTTAQLIGNRFKAAFEMARGGLSRFQNMMQSVNTSVPKGVPNSRSGSSGGMGIVDFLKSPFGKFSMIAGGITSAIATVNKVTSVSDARSSSIAQLKQLGEGEENMNGLNADQVRNYGGKYANRIGMSADDFMDQSLQLMNSTGGAFGSIGEAMNYNELMQKQMKVSGVDENAANSVAVQWRQGLTKGFASQEINTVLEQAPVLAQRLADTMGIEMGALKDAAAKGEITAEVAKKALFDNADDINAKFASMPRTWEQIGAVVKNNASQALEPFLDKVSALASNPAIPEITEKLTEGFSWFADVAGSAFDFVLETISKITPFIEDVVVPIKEILFSVWDIIKGLIDDIVNMFTADEEFGKSAQSIWGEFKVVLERIKPIVEGIIQTIAGGIKILMGAVKNVITLAENARTWLHNKVSGDDNQLEYKSFDADVFVDAAGQMAEGYTNAWKESAILTKDIWTKNLTPVPKSVENDPTVKNDNDDRIQAGLTPTKPLHVKQVGKTKIDKESLQLLKELAQAEIINRVNNIQPAITANFGDVHETADVDAMLDRLEKDVVSARGQNLMLQTGMQYAL